MQPGTIYASEDDSRGASSPRAVGRLAVAPLPGTVSSQPPAQTLGSPKRKGDHLSGGHRLPLSLGGAEQRALGSR